MVKNSKKRSRYRYFILFISVDITSKSKKIWSDIQEIINILKLASFISQVQLEKALDNLIINDTKRDIFLEDFDAQLETDLESGLPYWKIALKTTAATTGRRITESLCNTLNQDKSTLKNSIRVKSTDQLERAAPEARVVLTDTPWFPGYFTHSTVLFRKLFHRQDVQEMIKDNPL